FPSAVRGAAALRSGLPSGVRGAARVGYSSHCAVTGRAKMRGMAIANIQGRRSALLYNRMFDSLRSEGIGPILPRALYSAAQYLLTQQGTPITGATCSETAGASGKQDHGPMAG